MPGPTQQRFNAKARGSVAGGSHKKRKRFRNLDEEDVPVHSEPTIEHEERRGKMSSKKRKRLESYVSKKLKTEERLRTLQLLASLAPSQSTSAALASTATLGQNPLQPSSARERSERREDKLVRRGIEQVSKRFDEVGSGSDSEASEDAGRMSRSRKGKEKSVDVAEDSLDEVVSAATVPVHRESKGVNGKTKHREPKKADWNPNLLPTQPASDSSDFDSSGSAYDSPVEAGPSTPTIRTPTPPSVVTERLERPRPTEPPRDLGYAGALKRDANGEVLQPKLIARAPKKRVGGRRLNEKSNGDKEIASDASSSEIESRDADDVGEDSEGSDIHDEADESGNDDLDIDTEETVATLPIRKRALGFKTWALQQMGQAPQSDLPEPTHRPQALASNPPSANGDLPFLLKEKPPFVGPLGGRLEIPASSLINVIVTEVKSSARPAITRRSSVSESRMDLPILTEEQAIVEAIRLYPVVVIAGETGSGKTTQVPQMLYEAGFGFKGSEDPGMIAITQPRRVAAVSLSARVKTELNLPPSSSLVAHQIRYSSTSSPSTAIKFMTDGVLLRELASDFLLSRYSVVIVDEAHERGVNTDVLIGVLSRVSKLREKMWREGKDTRPLRIVIMSATLRIHDFTANPALFSKPPPVIHIPARQHSVTTHFSRRTIGDYVNEAYKKVCKIHARLPPGGVLVFLTGQGEIQALCRKLEKRYNRKPQQRSSRKMGDKPIVEDAALAAEDCEVEDVDLGKQDDLAADVDDGVPVEDPEALDSDEEGIPDLGVDEVSDVPMHVLPLYSLLPTDQQMQVFRSPPSNHRLVIIATNVAETSITIPGIRYVVDSGRAKERHYDPSTGVQAFQVSWISKASASQRAGRAGRTGPGHCYRLYSSALYEDHFEAFSKPEILRMPIEGVVLQMKSMNIEQVVNFPFPTPPDRFALKKAEDLLTHLGALSTPTKTRMVLGVQQAGRAGGQVTDLGKAMAAYPVSPRFAKMLVIGSQHGCLPYVVAVVACLSVGDPFLHEQSIEELAEGSDEDDSRDGPAQVKHIRSEQVREKEERKEVRRKYFKAQSQFLSLGLGTSDIFKMLAAVGAHEYDPTPSFCMKNFLRPKAMQEIQQLRSQISNIAKLSMSRLSPPSDTQLKILRQILTAGFIDQIAVRLDLTQNKPAKFISCRNVAYRASHVDEEVFIHPSSSLFHRPPPDFIVFQEVVRTSRPWLKGITKINPAWLSELGKGMCSYSRPMEVGVKAGGRVKEVMDGEREVVVVPRFEGLGVDLPPVKMRQRREGTRWVLVE